MDEPVRVERGIELLADRDHGFEVFDARRLDVDEVLAYSRTISYVVFPGQNPILQDAGMCAVI